MNCKTFMKMIPQALDNVSLRTSEFESHRDSCVLCRREWEQLERTKHWVHSLPRHTVPHDLDMAIRVEASRHSSFSFGDRFWMRIEDALRPLALPAFGGLALAVICFAMMLNTLWMTPSLANNSDDIQVQVRTAPRTRPNNYLTIATEGNSNLPDEPLLVETHIDPRGRVYDFKVLSGPDTPSVIHSLEQVLYFTVFDPATSFGRPTDGKAILSFRKVKVLG
ncbi:MAG: hypothetical protein PHX83_02815 [Acidobacteriia bacterium]|nr:hypothetical protein [Terriglobia bacterium]